MRAARISYIGELGWEIYVPSDAAVPLYDMIREEGRGLGLRNVGTFALGSLRVEKGFCAWGHDIGPNDTPLEAGLGFTTKLNKPIPFIGRDALQDQKTRGIAKRRVLLAIDDPAVILLGAEPIVADGEIVGQITSASYGHTLGRSVAMGFIRLHDRSAETLCNDIRWEVEVALKRYSATASLRPLYDPNGERMRVDDTDDLS